MATIEILGRTTSHSSLLLYFVWSQNQCGISSAHQGPRTLTSGVGAQNGGVLRMDVLKVGVPQK